MQSTSIAIMATGMVLIIVSRNIDLSVGVGARLPRLRDGDGPDRSGSRRPSTSGSSGWYTWIVALAVGLLLGAVIGGVQGFLVGYAEIPAFIVTLGGFLVWRGLIFRFKQGQTLAPLDKTFQLLGGGPKGVAR